MSNTSVIHDPNGGKSKLVVSLPIHYRIHRIKGVLDHEIGTHFIRKYNDRGQVWYQNRKKFDLKPYIICEEGLACLNQTLTDVTRKRKLLIIRHLIQKENLIYIMRLCITIPATFPV